MGILRWMGDQMRFPVGAGGGLMCGLLVLQHAPITRWAIGLFGAGPGDRVLDIGCGNGCALRLLARSGAEVAGVDPSEVAVRIARRRNGAAIRAGLARVDLGEAAKLPYPDACFDRVLSLESFYFWNDPVAGLREARRVLKPGGSLLIVMEVVRDEEDPERNRRVMEEMDCPFYSGPEVRTMLEEAGFVFSESLRGPKRDWLGLRAVAA